MQTIKKAGTVWFNLQYMKHSTKNYFKVTETINVSIPLDGETSFVEYQFFIDHSMIHNYYSIWHFNENFLNGKVNG